MRRRATIALVAGVLVASTVAVAAALAVSGPPHQGVVTNPGASSAGVSTTSPLAARGASLFAANCASCHGTNGEGVLPSSGLRGAGDIAEAGPSLRHVGALAADFYLSTGSMPLSSAHAQPSRSRVLFSGPQTKALVAYVASLGRGPAIPAPNLAVGKVNVGMRLFTDNCAGCHQIVAQGGYVTGARVPSLEDATPTQIAEAVRIGPYLMPRFSTSTITPYQLDSIIAYVRYTKHPDDPGGWSIGHLGPWPEGLVTWLLAAAVLVATCILIGERTRKR